MVPSFLFHLKYNSVWHLEMIREVDAIATISLSAKDHIGRETAPRGVGLLGRTLKTIRTEGAQGSPHKLPS